MTDSMLGERVCTAHDPCGGWRLYSRYMPAKLPSKPMAVTPSSTLA